MFTAEAVKIAYRSKWFMMNLQCIQGICNMSMLRIWDDNVMQGTRLLEDGNDVGT